MRVFIQKIYIFTQKYLYLSARKNFLNIFSVFPFLIKLHNFRIKSALKSVTDTKNMIILVIFLIIIENKKFICYNVIESYIR